jgi:hypothetical protein
MSPLQKPSGNVNKESNPSEDINASAVALHQTNDEHVPQTTQSSRSSSKQPGHGEALVNGTGHVQEEQIFIPYNQGNQGNGQDNRQAFANDRYKGTGTPSARGGSEFVKDRGSIRNRDWPRDKPESAREKVESWRDRETNGDQNPRREGRSDRGRGGYRGRGGSHNYNPAFGASYTAPLPQNGFESARSNSHNESRSRQAFQPFQPNPSTNGKGGNPRSQSIPIGAPYAGYYGAVPANMSQGLPPVQTDMQVYGYASPMQMQPGIMSAMPYHDPLNSYALLSMVMTQV